MPPSSEEGRLRVSLFTGAIVGCLFLLVLFVIFGHQKYSGANVLTDTSVKPTSSGMPTTSNAPAATSTATRWTVPQSGDEDPQLFEWWGKQPVSSIQRQPSARIEWHSILGAQPIKKVLDDNVTNVTAEAYSIGTFASGAYNGDAFMLVLLKHKPQGWIIGYGYFIATSDSKTLAWDRTLLFDCYGIGPCGSINRWNGLQVEFQKLGFTEKNETYLTAIPVELHYRGTATAINQPATFGFGGTHFFASTTASHAVDTTENGFKIIRVPDQSLYTTLQENTIVPPHTYSVLLPFGAEEEAFLTPDFWNRGSVPSVVWSTGKTAIASYHPYSYYYNKNIPDCFAGLTFDQLKALFTKAGVTSSGSPVYEVNPAVHSVYECLSKKSTLDPSKSPLYSPSEITTIHPLFFWQNLYGDWYAYVRDDVVPFDLLGHD